MTKQAKESKRRQPEVVLHFDDVPHFAVSGYFGGLNLSEGSISFYQDRLIPRKGPNPGQLALDTVEQHFMVNVKMSPIIFKRMALWMLEHVKRYEKEFGEITIAPSQGEQKPEDNFGFDYR